MVFSFYIKTYKLEDNKEYILIVQFQVTNQFVRGIGEETLQAAEESVIVIGTYFMNKLLNY